VIVDDETLSRTRLLELFKNRAGFEIVGVGRTFQEAVQLIESASPDLVFLNLQIVGMDGFAAIRELALQSSPLVVFVSANDKHVIQAFEAHAFDYILAPFSDDRVESTLRRAGDYIRMQTADRVLRGMVRLSSNSSGDVQEPGCLKRIAIRSEGRIIFLRVRDIDWIAAAGAHVYLHVGPKSYKHRANINRLQKRLDPESFVRVHRSTIINVDRVVELTKKTKGDYRILLKDGINLMLSRGYRTQLEAGLQQSL
jgi:two-component system, LytTR family, response regulator